MTRRETSKPSSLPVPKPIVGVQERAKPRWPLLHLVV